jgi:hypothetical protein
MLEGYFTKKCQKVVWYQQIGKWPFSGHENDGYDPRMLKVDGQ